MIKVQFGATGTDFNEANFGFQALIGANCKVVFNSGETEDALDVARFYSKKNDYVELKGQFVETDETGTYLDNFATLSSYKVVDGGKVAFMVSDLDLKPEHLTGGFKELSTYLKSSSYDITGNNAANDLYSAKGDDELSGLDGNDFLFSGAGQDRLEGGKGNDIFDGGHGDDTIIDKLGADTLVFRSNGGTDTVTGFSFTGKAHDVIDLSEFGENLKFKDLDISRSGKSDVLIDFGHGDEILLKDVDIKQIDAGDFQF